MHEFPIEAMPTANYFEDTYIGKLSHNMIRRTPIFAKIWNLYPRVNRYLGKMNNNVEGCHSAFRTIVVLRFQVSANLRELFK